MPRFDLSVHGAALTGFFARESGARDVALTGLELLAGGAIQENWGVEAVFVGGPLAGRQRLILRTDAPTGIAWSLGRAEEFAVLQAAYAAGVTVPEPLFLCADPGVIGRPFFVMRRLAGSADGRRITADPALQPALPRVAARLGRELARLQRIRPPRPDLAFLPQTGAVEHLAHCRAYLDRHHAPRPVLEWAARWLERHVPPPLPPVLCHRDFRTGNYLIDGNELAGILDWEFAGWGDPDEDIGWLCCKGWRFARLDRELGGIADRRPFYAAYEDAAGRRPEPARVFFWEVLANVRWAVIALQQSDRHLLGGARELSIAIIGRRAAECELELLMLLDPEGRTGVPAPDGPSACAPDPIRDRPGGLDLLALGRELLIGELLPLVPAERRRELRLLATAIAIAGREAAAGERPVREILARLQRFYRRPQEGALLLRRIAADLRAGAFEACEERARAARAILWQLTVAKLGEGNPAFLAENGFGD